MSKLLKQALSWEYIKSMTFGVWRQQQFLWVRAQTSFILLLIATMESYSYINKTTNTFKQKVYPTLSATSMSQNFFHNLDDDFDYPQPPAKSEIIPRKQPTRRGASRKMGQTKLAPAKQPQKVDVFQSNSHNVFEDLEEIVLETPKKKEIPEVPPISKQNTQKKQAKRRSSMQAKKQANLQAQQKTSQTFQQSNPFVESKHREGRQQKSVLVQQEAIFLPVRAGLMFQDENEPVQKQKPKQLPKKQAVVKQTGLSSIFNFGDEAELRRQIFLELKEDTTIKMEIIRDKGGFNRFWPQFHLRFAGDKQHLMSAKKTSSRPTSTFIISRSITDFEQSSPHYLGKVKSNALGDIYNIFGPGLNPSNAQAKKVSPRELLATLSYNTSLFYANGPRKFTVFTKKPQVSYYSDFSQVNKYEDQIPLSSLYSYHANKQKIRLIYNKKPTFNEKDNTYTLDFKGKAPVTSVKNFIMEQEQNGSEILLFGKVTDQSFNLEMSSSISPYVAFAVAIASFDNRLISQ